MGIKRTANVDYLVNNKLLKSIVEKLDATFNTPEQEVIRQDDIKDN